MVRWSGGQEKPNVRHGIGSEGDSMDTPQPIVMKITTWNISWKCLLNVAAPPTSDILVSSGRPFNGQQMMYRI